MQLCHRFAISPRTTLILRFAGILVFAAAFFLPAVRFHADAGHLLGWECARATFLAATGLFQKSDPDLPRYQIVLITLSGLINPLILLALSLSFAPQYGRVRRILAVAVLVCMACSWTLFALMGLQPLIGHFLWIAGALMILAPEALCGWFAPFVSQ